MDTDQLKNLLQKMENGVASQEEQTTALRELNILIEKYNKILKEAFDQDSPKEQ